MKSLGRKSILRKTAFIVMMLLCALGAVSETKTEITYLHRYDNEECYVYATYIDNLCYVKDGHYKELLICPANSADGIYFPLKYSRFTPFSAKQGKWLNGKENTYSSEIASEKKTRMTKSEILSENVKLVSMVRDEYFHGSDMPSLADFCELVNLFSKDQLRLLRNTIYAMHGYRFKASDLREIFSECDWYEAASNFSEDNFTETERVYLKLIKLSEQLAK